MLTPNKIVFSKNEYSCNRDEMCADIGKQLALLLRNKYVCKVRNDDTDIIVIEYEHDDDANFWGIGGLYWLDDEEAEWLENLRANKHEE